MSPETQTENSFTINPPSQFEEKQTPVLYDANAVQRVPFFLSEDEEIEPIILVFQPLSDGRYADFDAATAVKIVDDGKNAAFNAAKPSGNLWDELVSAVENIEFEDAEGDALPSDWRERFDLLQFKVPSLNNYLAVAVYEEPKSNKGKFVVGKAQSERVIYADLYFNGEAVTTKHFLQKMNFEFAKEIEKTHRIPIQSRSKGLQETGDYTLPSSAKGKGELYDRMKAKDAEGFVDNVVPLRVKVRVIDHIARAVIQQKK